MFVTAVQGGDDALGLSADAVVLVAGRGPSPFRMMHQARLDSALWRPRQPADLRITLYLIS